MKNKAIRNIAILGSIAIVGILSIQIYWINQALNLQQKKFQEDVFFSLKRVAERISNYNKMDFPQENPVKQLSSDYYIVNIREVIDANILDLYLRKEFARNLIQTDYEYAIYDCSSDKMVYGEYVSINDKKDKTKIGDLPKYDEFIYYFGVNFPNRTSYLMASNKLWMFFSFLLFLTVLFFVYALNIILRQKRLSELQKDFINNMTHEFKTPISTINIASTALIENEQIRKEAGLQNYTRIIKEQNERLNRQVEKVLQIAEIERESLEMNKESVALHKLLNSAAASVNLLIEKSGGKTQLALNATSDTIKCDKLHMTNIVYNILDNAIKYCGTKPNIYIETKEMEGFLCLEINDTGVGIPAEHLQKVKRKFYRVPTGKIHDVKGFGLGLFYVDQVCKAHHWQWEIKSKPKEGTQIRFKLKYL